MQFPWACESFKNNYSKDIAACYSSATDYMPMATEWRQTKLTLVGAIKSKEKKLSILAKDSGAMSRSLRSIRSKRSQSNMSMPVARKSRATVPRRLRNRKYYQMQRSINASLYDTQSLMDFKTLNRMSELNNPTRMKKLPPLKKKQRLENQK